MSAPAASAAVFSAHAAGYDAQRRRLVPRFDAFYGAVGEALAHVDGPLRRLLDLGAGTGLLSSALTASLPGLEVELLDGSAEMLAVAEGRLGDAVAATHVQDLRDPLPAGPFDAVVSALAIHHLEHADKRRLFAAVHERLRPGGAFVNAEQVSAPSPWLESVYEEVWTQDCVALGASEADLAGARARMRHDRCADLESQLEWVREAGFGAVDCVYKSWRFAVLAGFKSGRR